MRMEKLSETQLTFLKMVEFGIADWSAPSGRATARQLEALGLLRLRKGRGRSIACTLEPAGQAALHDGSGRRPARLQLSRRAGFRLPAHAVKVDRSTPFGNPFRVQGLDDGKPWAPHEGNRLCRDRFAVWLGGAEPSSPDLRTRRTRLISRLASIRGCDLACWCRLCFAHARGRNLGDECAECMPCHADVLLVVANKTAGDPGPPAASR